MGKSGKVYIISSCLPTQILSALLFPFVILFIKFSETDIYFSHEQEGSGDQQSTEMVSYMPTGGSTNNQIVPENQPECNEPAKFTTSNRQSLKKKLRHKLYQVNFASCGKPGDGIGVFAALHYYHTAPVVKFCYHTVGSSIRFTFDYCICI